MTTLIFDNKVKASKNLLQPAVISLLSVILLTVWPVPHTIAIRQIALALLLIALVFSLKKDCANLFRLNPQGIFYTFIALTLWITIHSLFIAVDQDAVGHLTSHWGRITGSVITGSLLGYYVSKQQHSLPSGSRATLFLILAIALPFILHTGVIIVDSFSSYLQTGSFGKRLSGFTDGPDKISYLTNMVMAAVLAVFAYLFVSKQLRKHLLLTVAICIIGAITIINQYFASMRNGIACAGLMSLITIIYISVRSSLSVKAKLGALILSMMVLAVGIHMQAQDSRWQTFSETLPLSWDTKSNMSWLDKTIPMPTLSDGSTVSHSNYVRIAWLKEGMLLIAENPLGRGFHRSAFGRALMEKYSVSEVHSLQSHSGIIDFTVATGIPGGILLYGLFLLMFIYGLKSSVKSPSLIIPGLGLALLVTDFGFRSIVDSILRDHMFEMFMFISSVFVAYIAAVEKNLAANPSKT